MMQYDNYDTDKTLKQMEDQSLPDLSKMNEHWEQMKATLSSNVQPANTTRSFFRRPGFYALAATFIGLIVLVIVMFNKTRTEVEKPLVKTPVIEAPVDESKPYVQPTIKPQNVKVPYTAPDQDITVVTTAVPFPYIRDTTLPADKNNTVVITQPKTSLSPDYSAQLESFFEQLEKPAQQFVINTKKDTVLFGIDGSAFLIPANTFSMASVTILLKEFYSLKDIVSNRLTTMSDDRQLITGGMIHITAVSGGQQVQMQPGKSIRWFIPDTSSEMRQMQVFTGVEQSITQEFSTADSATLSARGINWIPQQRNFSNSYLQTWVRVLDLRDTPYRIRRTKKRSIAMFRLSDNNVFSKEEIEKRMHEKYPEYDVVKVKEKYVNRLSYDGSLNEATIFDGVGDSIWLKLETAKKYNMPAKDTVTRWAIPLLEGRFPGTDNQVKAVSNVMANRYGVDINTLGWINCDRFYRYGLPKVPLRIELNDRATNYYTLLIFDKIRSVMAGIPSGKEVIFQNIPEGMTGKVVVIGIKDEKSIMAIKDIKISRTPIKDLVFEEVSADEYKEEIAVLDK